MPHCSLMSMGTPLFYFKIEVIIWQIFSGQSLNKNLLSLLFQRNYLKVIPHLHCASLLRIICGVISARSCTRTLKTWRICLNIEFCQLKNSYSSQFDSRGKQFGSNILTRIQLSVKIKLKKFICVRHKSWLVCGVFSWVWAHKEFTITWNAFL